MDAKKIEKYLLPSGYYDVGRMQRDFTGDRTSATLLNFFGNLDSDQPMLDDTIDEIEYAIRFNANKQAVEESEEEAIIKAAYARCAANNGSREDWRLMEAVGLTRQFPMNTFVEDERWGLELLTYHKPGPMPVNIARKHGLKR